MENSEVARILRETAQLLEIDGAIIGRYRSYEKAAELIESLAESVEELARKETLTELPGIGQGLADHINEILKTGDYALRAKLLKKYPVQILELLNLQSLGAKKVGLLFKIFDCSTIEQLDQLAREQKLREIPGFGEKSEDNILRAIAVHKKVSGRFLIVIGEQEAARLVDFIAKFGALVTAVTPTGSLRRGKETVGDLDLLVTLARRAKPAEIEAISEHVLSYAGIEQVLARGENKISFRLASGLQVDVRLLEPNCQGAALIYFTGSKEHNVALRGRANQMGYTLNEYALATLENERRVAGASEEEVYAKLGLDFIPPELRENTGEIDAAENHRLPHLVELADIHGDLQMHTTASDGKMSIEEMGAAARALGYQYIAITDHSKAVTVANGMDEKRTREQIAKIRAANTPKAGIRILTSIEVDILKNGRLDMDDDVLAQLEVVVASVHSYLSMEREEMTDRLLAAIENPYTQIIAHPTGRLLLRRDASAYDMERILDAARKHNVIVECNASPERLDLKDVYLRMAKERGVRVVISTDAHTAATLNFMRYGVLTARRGWLEKKDVVNTLPLQEFLAALRPKPGAPAPREHVPQEHAAATRKQDSPPHQIAPPPKPATKAPAKRQAPSRKPPKS
jgi:DNA polymerase (family 10)